MKNFLKLSLLAAGLAAVSVPFLHADTAADGAAKADRHPRLKAALEKRAHARAAIAKRLDLTADQIAQLKSKRAATVDALKALKQDSSLTKEQKHAKAREILQSARTDMRSTLTPEQQAKAEKMRERFRALRPGR